jgi:hypothetical protein
MPAIPLALDPPDPHTTAFYHRVLRLMRQSRLPFLVGGAYALAHYTGVVRHTKDLDLFVRPADAGRALAVLERAGFHTEMTFPHWLGKAFAGDDFIDVIFSSGNALCSVDDEWFAHAVRGEVLGVEARVCPAEEMLWQKAFIMERERFDGADVLHLLRARGPQLDWARLLRRFGPHWRVLLGHLVLFGFVYPADQGKVPADVLEGVLERLREETRRAPAVDKLCRGTLLSRMQYLPDTERWGYRDARLPPGGGMTPEEIVHWTAAGR